MTVDPRWRKNRRPVGHSDPHCAAGGGNGPGVDSGRLPGWGHWLSSNQTCLPVPCLALPQRSAIAVTSHRPWPPAGLRSRTTGVGELSSTLTDAQFELKQDELDGE